MSVTNETPNTLTCSLGFLMDARDAALVTLVAGEMQLAVHRSVLVAKSAVFAKILAHDTAEGSSSRIDIADIEPEVLQQLLLFMYQDRTPQLCSMAPRLLVAADKYCMADLKAQCELQLIRDLSVENVVTSASLALRHSCTRLKKAAACLFQANIVKVADTAGWMEAVRNNSEEFVEVCRLLAATPAKTRNTCQEEMDKNLLEAVKDNRLKKVRELSATGAYVMARDRNRRTALHCATDGETTRCLLEAGAVVNARDEWHRTPLHAALQRRNTDVARMLVAASSDVNVADVYGDTPLHLAAQWGDAAVVKALLDVGADKGAINNLRETPLDVARRRKMESLMSVLSVSDAAGTLEANENPKMPTCDADVLLDARDAALIMLVAGEMQLAVHRSVLVAKSPVFSAMLSHDTAEANSGRVDIADMEPEVLQQLLLFMYQDRAPQLCSMAPQLLVAADKYCMADLKAQCELQLVDDLSVENFVMSALLALRHSCTRLKETAVCFLQSNFTKVMVTDGWAEAVRNNPEEFVEVCHLLAATPAKTRSTSQEETDRKLLEAAQNGKSSRVKDLIAMGAYVRAQDENGRTALHRAAEYGSSADCIKLLLQAGADVEARDTNGRTALHYAAASGRKISTECLLEAGACADLTDRWLQTPLHAAVQKCNKPAAKLLVAASGDVDSADVYGDTPLHLAAQWGDTDVVEELLDAGADTGVRNYFKETPLDVAKKCNMNQLLAMLG